MDIMSLIIRALRTALIMLIVLLGIRPASAQEEFVYEDPSGHFSLPLGENWRPVNLNDNFGQFQYLDTPILVTLNSVSLDGDVQSSEAAVIAAFDQIGMTSVSRHAGAGLSGWELYIFTTTEGESAAAAAKVLDGVVIVLLLTGDQAAVASPPQEVIGLLGEFRFYDAAPDNLPATVQAFESFVQELAVRDNVSISVAASMNGQTVYSAGFGSLDGLGTRMADGETVYQWGSSTKIVTVTAVMQLWERGLVDLDAPISDYLAYFPAQFGITVRQLMTHSSGLPEAPNVTQYISTNDAAQLDPAEIARTYAAGLTTTDFEPGTDSRYVNYNFLLLGEIVHEVSGISYVDYVRQHILQPLGMTRTDFVYTADMLENAAQTSDSYGQEAALRELLGDSLADALIARTEGDTLWFNFVNVLPPWGGLHGPVTEQLHLLQMHSNGGLFNGVAVLQPETVALMQTLQVGSPQAGFGLGWRMTEVLGRQAVGHQGGGPGISMEMQLLVEDGIAISVMTNRTGYNAASIVEAALNVLLSTQGT